MALWRKKDAEPRKAKIHIGAVSTMPGGIFDLLLASLFVNVLALAMPLTLLQVYDRIIPSEPPAP